MTDIEQFAAEMRALREEREAAIALLRGIVTEGWLMGAIVGDVVMAFLARIDAKGDQR